MPVPPEVDLSFGLECPHLGLRLRPWEVQDAEAVVALCGDPLIQEWVVTVPTPYTLQDALGYLDFVATEQTARRIVTRAVVDAADGRVLGTVGLHDLQSPRAAEIGYWTAPWGRRRGVAWRATDLMTRWAHANGIHRVELLADRHNAASLAVAARAGFLRDGLLRESHRDRQGRPTSMVLHSRLPQDALPPLGQGVLSRSNP